MEKKVNSTITRYQMVQESDVIIVGVSGGPDSMALLHLLNAQRQMGGFVLYVAHINHELRGEQADIEQQFVEQWAQTHGITCFVFRKNVASFAKQKGLSFEAAGHQIRANCFQQVALQVGATKLALGHHNGDVVETVLMHLIQGCGLDGIASMAANDGWIIRPLIDCDKQEILAYCHRENIVYHMDETNEQEVYLRNRIRKELIPILESYNGRIQQGLTQLNRLMQVDQSYFIEQTEMVWKEICQVDAGITIDLSEWQTIHPAMQSRILRKAYQCLHGNRQQLQYDTLQQVLQISNSNRGYKQYHLPHGIIVEKQYQKLHLSLQGSKQQSLSYCYPWNGEEKLIIPQAQASFFMEPQGSHCTVEKGFFVVTVDRDKLGSGLAIRTRRNGDRIWPLGAKGSKKLKDYFIDKKIPLVQRDRVAMLTRGQEVLWIPGMVLSHSIVTDQQTKHFCLLRWESHKTEETENMGY